MVESSGIPHALRQHTGFLLARSSGLAIRTSNKRLVGLGLSVRQYSVLAILCDQEEVTQRGLASALALDPSQVVALVDDLEGRGLIKRRADPRDRRNRLLAPTEHGRTVHGEADERITEASEELLEPLSVEERAQLRSLLQRIVDR